jgi:hypothetical protein
MERTSGHPQVKMSLLYTDKKEKKIFLIFKEIQRDRVQFKSYMTNGLLICGEIFALPHI